jgi:hypothetical protein
LHADDVLRSVADSSEGAARDWAATLLALRDPASLQCLPSSTRFGETLAARGAPRLPGLLREALSGADSDATFGLALRALQHGTIGETASFAKAILRPGAFDGPGGFWRAYLLTGLAQPTPSALRSLALGDHPEREFILPAAALMLTPSSELRATADALVTELTQRLQKQPVLGWNILCALGAPPLVAETHTSPEQRAVWGARIAGGVPPVQRAGRGSQRTRARRLVIGLLEDVAGAPAAFLSALARHGLPAGEHVEAAAWLATFTTADPVTDVLRGAGGCPGVLPRARAAVTVDDLDRTAASGTPGASDLLLALLDSPSAAEAADMLLEHVAVDPDDQASALRLQATAPHLSHLTPELLSGPPPRRNTGLILAPFAPTEPTLEALLNLPIPADSAARQAFGFALASMGDPTVLPALRDLRSLDPERHHLEAIGLAESILHTRV